MQHNVLEQGLCPVGILIVAMLYCVSQVVKLEATVIQDLTMI